MELLNFVVFFLTSRNMMHLNPKQIHRRQEFKREVRRNTGITKHKCAICGRTDRPQRLQIVIQIIFLFLVQTGVRVCRLVHADFIPKEELRRAVTVEELMEESGLSRKAIEDAVRISGGKIESIAAE